MSAPVMSTPFICSLPPQQEVKPLVNTTVVELELDESAVPNRAACAEPLHNRAFELVSYFQGQADAIQHVIDDHAREQELRAVAEEERNAARAEAAKAQKKVRELEAAVAAAAVAAAALEAKLRSEEKKRKETEHKLKDTTQKLHDTEKDRDHVTTERNAARKERDSFKHERDAARTERDTYKHERNEARHERDAAVKQRDGYQCERDAARKERDGFRTERDAARKQRDTYQTERDSARKERDALKTELDTAKSNVTFYMGREKKLEGLLETANKGEAKANKRADAANHRADKLEEEKDQAIKAQMEAEKALHELKQSQGPPLKQWLHNDAHRAGDYYIDCIEYGGKIVTDPAVYRRVLDCAQKGGHFTISNANLGGDPWPHWTKTCTISFTVGNKGPFRYATGWEGEKLCFEH